MTPWSLLSDDLLTSPLAQAAGQPSLLVQLAPMILIFMVFYVIWFLPLRKKQKALDEFLANLQKGDQIVTNGGLYGKVLKAEGEVVVLELADNVRVRVARRAITGREHTSAANGGK